MRRIRTAAFSLVLFAALAPIPSRASVTVEPVSFTVENPLEPGVPRTVRGFLYEPDSACGSSVMLLLHGLSYGAWAWDLTVGSQTYSVARHLAERGYPAVAIDELGYNSSDHPNGYTLTVQSYAAVTSQIVQQLRDAPFGYQHVGLIGHSAGTEIAELTAGLFGGIDVLVATAYTHFPSQRIVEDFITGDVPRALMGEDEYFGETPENRAEYMYNLDYADPAVVAADTARAVDTPSGEILSISNQPSRWAQPLIGVPVLLVLAQEDVLFPVEYGEQELTLFAGALDTTLHVVPTAGHSFMLHPNAAATNDAIADWLDDRPSVIPHC